MKNRLFAFTCSLLVSTAGILSAAPSVPVVVSVDPSKPGFKIADDYTGLSYETKRQMVDQEGKHYFRPDNAPLIQMLKTLEIKNLRVGGNTVDSPKVTIPEEKDIDSLFALAKAADTKVIYSFRLHNGNAQASAQQAKYIADHYGDRLICFSIGNEPDIYVHSYAGYLKAWKPIYEAINQAVPKAIYCGPSLTSPAQNWAGEFARDYVSSGRILYITQHEYVGGAGEKIKDPVYGRDLLLSSEWHDKYQKYYDHFVPLFKETGLPYRLEEANNFYNGGAKDVSDTFAAAIWGVDYLYWWASHGSQGINFHNGDEVAAGQELRPCRYASFTSTPDGYFARPLAYGIKLFNLGARGQIIPSVVAPAEEAKDLNLVSYAVLGADKKVYVTLLNKEHGATARDAEVTLKGVPSSGVQTMALVAPDNDVAAKEGVTLGGNPIKADGTWVENWTDLSGATAGDVQVKVPAGSILLVRTKATP